LLTIKVNQNSGVLSSVDASRNAGVASGVNGAAAADTDKTTIKEAAKAAIQRIASSYVRPLFPPSKILGSIVSARANVGEKYKA
jgi:hypothetical protein